VILTILTIAGITSQHQLDSIGAIYRNQWQTVIVEAGKTYVCRGMTLWRFDSQGARMVCDEVVADGVFVGSFESL